jgi:hypothetical protein
MGAYLSSLKRPGQGLAAAFKLVLLALLLVSASSACSPIGRVRAFPLYPHPEHRRSPEAVAQLTGPVGQVDGVVVESLGTAFELLPGCHVVTLRRWIGEMSSNGGGAWSADLPTMVYAFRMRPGRLYAIDVDVRFRSSMYGTLKITAQERDGAGALLAEVNLVRSSQDVERCMAWGAGQATASSIGSAPLPAD